MAINRLGDGHWPARGMGWPGTLIGWLMESGGYGPNGVLTNCPIVLDIAFGQVEENGGEVVAWQWPFGGRGRVGAGRSRKGGRAGKEDRAGKGAVRENGEMAS